MYPQTRLAPAGRLTALRDSTTYGVGGNGGDGAGLFNTRSTVLKDCTVANNTTGNGGYAVCSTDCGAQGGRGGLGGGLYNSHAVTLTTVTLTANATGQGGTAECTNTYCTLFGGKGGDGGGIAQESDATAVIWDTTINDNATSYGGQAIGPTATPGIGGDGGGLWNVNSDLSMVYCVFEANRTSFGRGGGLYNAHNDVWVVNTRLTGNVSGGGVGGGAVYNLAAAPVFVNVLINGNYGNSYGGGFFNENGTPSIINSTLSGNEAGWDMGGGLYNKGSGVPLLRNSIVWGNVGGEQIEKEASAGTPDVQYSLVQGGFTGNGNISANPLFVREPDPGDGNWATPGDNDNGDLHLMSFSPAIDAGASILVPPDRVDVDRDHDFAETLPDDFGGMPRFSDVPWIVGTGVGPGHFVDMGAYEYQPRTIFLSLVSRGQ